MWRVYTVRLVARYSPETKSRAVRMVLDNRLAVKAVASEQAIVASTLGKWVNAARQRQRGVGSAE